jgi:predicted AlkP superfamily phosphohydrolase/phosphomutase
MTGIRAERHGLIYWTPASAHDYWDHKGDGSRFVRSSDIPYPTMFRILSNADIRVASVNMPVTFPPLDVNGIVVSGFLAPHDSEKIAHPSGFLSAYPDYRVDVEQAPDGDSSRLRTDREVAEYAMELQTIAEARHELFLDLLRQDLGFASVVYVGADRLSHIAWPQVESVISRGGRTLGERAIERYYSTLDRFIGEVSGAAPDANLIVSSDHGQGSPPPRVFAPNVWLKERGSLVLASNVVRRASHLMPSSELRRRLWRLYRRFRNIPRGATPFADWTKSVAFAIPMPHCRAVGIAVRGDRRLQEEIADSLLEFEDPETRQRPVETVRFSSDMCRDEGRRTYPELLALLSKEYGAVGRVDGFAVGQSDVGPSGYHEPEGILVAAGPDVIPGDHPERSIADIAPTVLSMLGVMPSPEMDGSVIPWLLSSSGGGLASIEAEPEVPDATVLTAPEESQIADHLRDLGYID